MTGCGLTAATPARSLPGNRPFGLLRIARKTLSIWSFQLYSARNFTPWDRVFENLATLGYREVEGYGALYADPSATRGLLDRNGLSMPTGHFSLDALEQDFDATVQAAKTLGVNSIYCPYITTDQRPPDAAGWLAFGKRLAEIGARVNAAGFGFGWHNHDFEFKALADGSLPMQLILDAAPGVDWEMDVAWVVRGGADPLAWIDRQGARITAAHVKDIALSGENADEDGWADVGQGVVDWRALLKALKEKTRATHFVVEHDNPSDLDRFAGRSITALNAMEA